MPPSSSSWRAEVARQVTDPGALQLPARQRRRLARVAARYPLGIPPHLLRCLRRRDPDDPIRRLLLPDPRELMPGGDPDPLDEERFRVGPGLIRRFPDRLLALVSASCPVRCRHCNRKRHWANPAPVARPADLARAVRRLARVREVILSGGEPLLLSDRRLDALLLAARARPGIGLVRIHTRMPAAGPARITPALVRMLRRHRPLWVVVHFNHARELTVEARHALARLRDAGLPLLNQGVLLRGVNDSVAALRELGTALAEAGVKPHYLFQLDRARGTLHFQVPLRRALSLIARLRATSSGLVVPQLMGDLPGRGGKVPLESGAVVRFSKRGAVLRGRDGRTAVYPE
jgi:lysine 2,3-aminomutase